MVAGMVCALCPIEGGALKPTDNNAWAHVFCTLWTPHAHVLNAARCVASACLRLTTRVSLEC